MNNKGMITIEACVIIPVILSVTVLLVWMGMYFYNKSTVSNAAMVAAVEGSRYAHKSNEEIIEIARDKAEEMLEGRLVCIDEVGINVETEYSQVQVCIKGNMNVPAFLIMGGIYDESAWGINISRDAPRLRSSQIVRTVNTIRKTVSENDVNNNVQTGGFCVDRY